MSKENELQKDRIECFTSHEPVLFDCSLDNLEKIEISKRKEAYSNVLNKHLLNEEFKKLVAGKLANYKKGGSQFQLNEIATEEIFKDLQPEIDIAIERIAVSLATELKIDNFYEEDKSKKDEQIKAINSITDNAISNITSNITFEQEDYKLWFN